MKRHALSLIFLLSLSSGSFAQLDPSTIPGEIKFDELFPRKPFTGRAASGYSWSHDDRYLAYIWNPYGTMGGSDLWLYDTKSGASKPLSSIELFAKIEAEAAKAIDRYKKDKVEEDKRMLLGDKEYREQTQKLKEENEKRREPLPSYPGISAYEWAHKSSEMLVVYRGDIFRWKIGDEMPTRLTKTKEAESQVEWLPDDSGFTYRRGQNIFRVKFDSAMVEQLNPDLPSGIQFGGHSLSPDGQRMVIFASKQGPPNRQVDYITYRNRFAEARKTDRSVADDDFSGESYIYIYNIADNVMGDGKPTEVWKWTGGEDWQESSISDHPWSSDSKKFTFVSWKRDKKELLVHVADADGKKVDTVYKTTSDGEHRTPSLAAPQFVMKDSKIALMLDPSGWRQIFLLDPVAGGVTQVTKGEFETYPIEASKDGMSLFVRATKEKPSTQDIYKVDLTSGTMQRLTGEEGFYGEPVFSHAQDRFALPFRSWSQLNELFLVHAGRQKQLTQSHRTDDFWKVVKQKPKLFTYTNRIGLPVNGFIFTPPNWKRTDKRPLMVYVYGGPLGEGKSVQQGDFNSTAYLFNLYLTQVLGYVTVCIDPRGQSGYGALFGKANWEKPGVAQTEDLTDGVKYLIENYGVDPTKVAINGWSFGGFQTQMCLYTAPDVFTLGIAGAGPTEWQNYNTWYTGGVIGNSPKGDANYLDKYSLTHLAKNLRSPLLLLHGVEDTNVLFQDTIKVYRELLQAGKGHLVELSIDPTGGHGMGGDMNNRDRHAIYLAFLLKHWGMPVTK